MDDNTIKSLDFDAVCLPPDGKTFKRNEQHDYFEGEENIRDIWAELSGK